MYFSNPNSTVSYCDFYDNDGGNFDGDVPADLGVLAATNANGDPCDIFQNIFLDPLFVNPYGLDFHLRQDSPCVDCGDPNSDPDPNDLTGIPDMGAYYYDRGELVIEVTDPVAGASWERGTTELITWTDNVYENVKLELYEDQTLVAVIDESTQSDGNYNWAIPGDGPVGNAFTIRISSVVRPDVFAFSDTFTLTENQAPVTVALTPANPPIEIPAGGGSFHFGIEITSTLNTSIQGDVWIKVVVPNGNLFGPVQQAYGITLNPGQTITVPDITQMVPAGMAAGTYIYRAYVGLYPGLVVDFDEFPVEILPGAVESASVLDWTLLGINDASFQVAELGETAQPTVPQQYALSAAYPNPFNPTTTINVALPSAADLSVVVYNVAGQRVATLAAGSIEPGTHSLTFDASNLASGLYFVRATVPQQLDQVKKAMLVR